MKSEQIVINYRDEKIGVYTIYTRYVAEIYHKGLNDYKKLIAENRIALNAKVDAYVAKLDARWNKILLQRGRIASTFEAESLTKDAIAAIGEIENLLYSSLATRHVINWEKLKDTRQFTESNPSNSLPARIAKITPPVELPLLAYSPRPDRKLYQPAFTFMDGLLKSQKEEKIKRANQLLQAAETEWAENCSKIDIENDARKNSFKVSWAAYEKKIHDLKLDNGQAIILWRKRKESFLSEQIQNNTSIDAARLRYLTGDKESILDYCTRVLDNSVYPDTFPKEFEIDYNSETKILVVEYSLPSPDMFPTLSEVKFIKGSLKEYHVSDAQKQKMFDSTMYNIALRTIYELFSSDEAGAIEAVSFNGWVNAINLATGKRQNNCIISIQIKKTEFAEVDLQHVDPKVCFKNFKGVGSSKLSSLTPVRPILEMDRNDRRFVNSYDVADGLDESVNLAAMDWEDFEHLIREVFAKEFNSNGGEVKVTQASKDGGVDAIAFDPDPIRGGKIVIQAKRYTNTVGVAAVRDLYGTVMNEGATKGILVTTADYGPDAYDFVKDKPLTLMNGANLLFLLEKHGHQAKIDIKAARLLRS